MKEISLNYKRSQIKLIVSTIPRSAVVKKSRSRSRSSFWNEENRDRESKTATKVRGFLVYTAKVRGFSRGWSRGRGRGHGCSQTLNSCTCMENHGTRSLRSRGRGRGWFLKITKTATPRNREPENRDKKCRGVQVRGFAVRGRGRGRVQTPRSGVWL